MNTQTEQISLLSKDRHPTYVHPYIIDQVHYLGASMSISKVTISLKLTEGVSLSSWIVYSLVHCSVFPLVPLCIVYVNTGAPPKVYLKADGHFLENVSVWFSFIPDVIRSPESFQGFLVVDRSWQLTKQVDLS